MKTWQMEAESELETVVSEVLALLPKESAGATVLALHGDLGAGKTTFTQTLARVLGVDETVVSPTFVVMKGYETEHASYQNLIHIDAYRIESDDEMRVMHFSEMVAEPATLLCIEWAEKIADLLPVHTVHLTFSASDGVHTISTDHEQKN